MPRPRKTHIAIFVLGAAVAALNACTAAEKQRAETARATEPGTTLAILVTKAGQPTVQRDVERDNPIDRCAADKRNVRALEYHVRDDAVTGPLRKLFGRPTVASMTVVCLDGESKVTSTYRRQF
jgi:hypothetical protein